MTGLGPLARRSLMNEAGEDVANAAGFGHRCRFSNCRNRIQKGVAQLLLCLFLVACAFRHFSMLHFRRR